MKYAAVDSVAFGDDADQVASSDRIVGRACGVVSELREPVTGATSLTLLGIAVGVVLGAGTKEEMGRAYAWRPIAAMQDGHADGDRADEDFPCSAMCELDPKGVPAQSSVALLVSPPDPIPAVIAHGNIREYSLLKGRVTVGHSMMLSMIGG